MNINLVSNAKLRWWACPLMLLVFLLASCAPGPSASQEVFEPAPASIDERLDTASIEDYVVALPPFAYHEESVNQFAGRVRQARGESDQNRIGGRDRLFVGGDGSWPSKDFVLDRDRRTLVIRVYHGESGMKDYTETMRRVPGGWMRGPKVDVE